MSIPPAGTGAGAEAATGVLPGLLEPPLDDRFERRGVDVVEVVPALEAGVGPAPAKRRGGDHPPHPREPSPFLTARREQISNSVCPFRSVSSSRIVRRV